MNALSRIRRTAEAVHAGILAAGHEAQVWTQIPAPKISVCAGQCSGPGHLHRHQRFCHHSEHTPESPADPDGQGWHRAGSHSLRGELCTWANQLSCQQLGVVRTPFPAAGFAHRLDMSECQLREAPYMAWHSESACWARESRGRARARCSILNAQCMEAVAVEADDPSQLYGTVRWRVL